MQLDKVPKSHRATKKLVPPAMPGVANGKFETLAFRDSETFLRARDCKGNQDSETASPIKSRLRDSENLTKNFSRRELFEGRFTDDVKRG